jgi:hypothetical protein
MAGRPKPFGHQRFPANEWSPADGFSASEPDLLSNENDVDAARVLLVDLEDLADAAVLPVGGVGAGVLERQAVFGDPLARLVQAGDELLGADDEDDMGRPPGVRSELAARGRRDDERSFPRA